jgi:hypothetical protein
MVYYANLQCMSLITKSDILILYSAYNIQQLLFNIQQNILYNFKLFQIKRI